MSIISAFFPVLSSSSRHQNSTSSRSFIIFTFTCQSFQLSSPFIRHPHFIKTRHLPILSPSPRCHFTHLTSHLPVLSPSSHSHLTQHNTSFLHHLHILTLLSQRAVFPFFPFPSTATTSLTPPPLQWFRRVTKWRRIMST